MTEDDAVEGQDEEFESEIDSEEFNKPATRGDLYALMLIVRLNQVLVETALLALDQNDNEVLKRKLVELDKSGSQASEYIKKYGKRLEKKKTPSRGGK